VVGEDARTMRAGDAGSVVVDGMADSRAPSCASSRGEVIDRVVQCGRNASHPSLVVAPVAQGGDDSLEASDAMRQSDALQLGSERLGDGPRVTGGLASGGRDCPARIDQFLG
jgi:hypothetical protein